MMKKHKIGNIVEVFTKKKVDFGSWRCAVIVAENRDSYTIRYHHLGGIAKSVHQVNTEDVRPCAPLTNGCVTWFVGDVVEALDLDGYWRVSVIKEVLGEDCYQIAVVGSIDEFRVDDISRIRVRLEWKENRWIILEKVSRDCENQINITRRRIHMQQQQQQQQCDYNWELAPESSITSKLLKRSSPDSPTLSDSYSESTKKKRAINKEAAYATIVDDSYSFIGNGDIPTQAREPKLLSRATKPTVSVSNISSVASCSINDAISDRGHSHYSAGCSEDNNCLSSDAESSRILVHEEGLCAPQSKQVDDIRPHDLDLRSYRNILETLYASGPLTWDLETSLTHLRMKFSVSNDEHLTELRRLKCMGGLGLRCH